MCLLGCLIKDQSNKEKGSVFMNWLSNNRCPPADLFEKIDKTIQIPNRTLSFWCTLPSDTNIRITRNACGRTRVPNVTHTDDADVTTLIEYTMDIRTCTNKPQRYDNK